MLVSGKHTFPLKSHKILVVLKIRPTLEVLGFLSCVCFVTSAKLADPMPILSSGSENQVCGVFRSRHRAFGSQLQHFFSPLDVG